MTVDGRWRSSGPGGVAPLHPDAHSFGALRPVGNGARHYEPRWAGPKWAEQLFRMAKATGQVKPCGTAPSYALLDVLDADGDLMQTYAIPNARAFRWWYRKVGWRLVREPADDLGRSLVDHGACTGRTYLERGQLVVVERGWRGKGPRNVLIRRGDGTRVVRPFRGLRRPPDGVAGPVPL